MSALATRSIPIVVAKPAETRAVRLVEQIRAIPIEEVRQRIAATRRMTDEEVRQRHFAEHRDRAEAAARRVAAL